MTSNYTSNQKYVKSIKRFILIFVAISIMTLLIGCNKNEDEETNGSGPNTYSVPIEFGLYTLTDEDAPGSLFAPQLTLNLDSQFTFVVDALSDTLVRGEYTITDGKIYVANDLNDDVYVFDITSSNQLKFDLEASTIPYEAGYDWEANGIVPLEDGAVFDKIQDKVMQVKVKVVSSEVRYAMADIVESAEDYDFTEVSFFILPNTEIVDLDDELLEISDLKEGQTLEIHFSSVDEATAPVDLIGVRKIVVLSV